MKFNFKQMLNVSAFYLEEHKSFIPKKSLSHTAKIDPKDDACCPNFQWRFWYDWSLSYSFRLDQSYLVWTYIFISFLPQTQFSTMKMKGIRNEKWRFLNKYLLIDQRLQLATLLFSVLVHSSQGALPLAPPPPRAATAPPPPPTPPPPP